MNRFTWHLLVAVALFSGFSAFDAIGDDEPFNLGEFLREDALQWLVLAVAVSAASYSALSFRQSLAEKNALSAALAASRSEGDRWRAAARVHSEGLAKAIRAQFGEWHLTASESDVAMLLLKGLSHKEIALLRRSTPATVRQQAAAIYGKSGLANRAELAAYFLEDLFPSGPPPLEANGEVARAARPIQHVS